ncbi:MAG: tetratricopeptide repeat protein [Treponema sp.]|nr:tetratricopeptide repeat protein [Treponema sp.]
MKRPARRRFAPPPVSALRVFFAALVFCAGVVSCAGLVSCAKDKADDAALLLYAKASSAYAKGNYSGTAELLDGAKNFVPSLVLRGKALYFRDERAGAEACFRRALRLNASSVEAALFLARLLRDSGKNDEAARVTETLIRNNPQDIRALRLASDLAAAGGDSESAAAFLDRAVEASAESALVFIDRARFRWIGGNGDGALEDLGRAEALLPWNTALSRSIGELRFLIARGNKQTEESEKTEEDK